MKKVKISRSKDRKGATEKVFMTIGADKFEVVWSEIKGRIPDGTFYLKEARESGPCRDCKNTKPLKYGLCCGCSKTRDENIEKESIKNRSELPDVCLMVILAGINKNKVAGSKKNSND